MFKSALFGLGLVAALPISANAQYYYPYYYPSYSYPSYTYPSYYTGYGYPYYSYYGWPHYSYYNPYASYPGYRAPLAYTDPYVAARPYSDGAGPRVSDDVGN